MFLQTGNWGLSPVFLLCRKSPITRDKAREAAGRNQPRRRGAQPVPKAQAAPIGNMSFLLYFVGFIVFIAGLGWLATLAGLSQGVVASAALVLLAIGVFTAISRARERDVA